MWVYFRNKKSIFFIYIFLWYFFRKLLYISIIYFFFIGNIKECRVFEVVYKVFYKIFSLLFYKFLNI